MGMIKGVEKLNLVTFRQGHRYSSTKERCPRCNEDYLKIDHVFDDLEYTKLVCMLCGFHIER